MGLSGKSLYPVARRALRSCCLDAGGEAADSPFETATDSLDARNDFAKCKFLNAVKTHRLRLQYMQELVFFKT